MTKPMSFEDKRTLGCFTPYISEDGADKLKEYKYAGGDAGIIYKIFYNPLALKLVQYLPDYIA